MAYAGGLLSSITDPAGGVTRRHLDSLGRPVSMTDPVGATSSYSYDDLNQVTGVTAPDGGATTMSYDPNGNVTRVTDARGNAVTTTTYDSMDRPVRETDPLGSSALSEYDVDGNLVRSTDRRGAVSVFRYDALGRRIFAGFGATGGAGSEAFASSIDYSWDAGNRMTQAVDSKSGTYSLAYDGLDQLTGEGGPQGVVGYGYDLAGRRSSMTAPGQETTGYSYDAAGRPTGVTRGARNVTVGYDQAGRRSSTTLPNGIEQSYGYDAASRLTGIDYTRGSSMLGGLRYDYDLAGRRVAQRGSFARTGLPEPLGSATYDAGNRRTTEDGEPLSYDAEGNLTAKAGRTYEWDARGQLESIGGMAGTAAFDYDPFGRRQSKTVGGARTDYVHDGGQVVQERTAGGNANLLTGLGLDEIYARDEAGGSESLLTDALGSTVALTDGAGGVSTSYTYDPFGNTSQSGAPSDNPWQYTGRENDQTGLYHYRARYYSPGMQRFTSQDPIGLAGGDTNLQAYVGGDPVSYRDPSGLFWQEVSDFSAGFGDMASFGLTNQVREWMGTNGVVNKCSGFYTGGQVAGGTVLSAATAGQTTAAYGGGLGASIFGGFTGGNVVSLSSSAQSGQINPGLWATNAATGSIFGVGGYGVTRAFGPAMGGVWNMGRDVTIGTGTGLAQRKEGC